MFKSTKRYKLQNLPPDTGPRGSHCVWLFVYPSRTSSHMLVSDTHVPEVSTSYTLSCALRIYSSVGVGGGEWFVSACEELLRSLYSCISPPGAEGAGGIGFFQS